MPRPRYDDEDDEGFPDIGFKPGTPSESLGGAYAPPGDSDEESGYSRPDTAGSGASGSESLTFEDWQKKAGIHSSTDDFSKTDGSARDARRRDVDAPEVFQNQNSMADQKAKLKSMMKGGGRMTSLHDAAKGAKAAQKAAHITTSKNPNATNRAKAREKVMKQRKDHEAWVEQLAAVCDATNVEKQRLAAEIIFLEHNMDRKKLLRVVLRLGRVKLFTGFQTWENNTVKQDRLAKQAEIERRKKEIEAFYAQIKADAASNDERERVMLAGRLANTSEKQYQLILNIFSKMTGDKTREYYSKWKGMTIDFRTKFVLMKRVLGRLMSAKTNSAWGAWYFHTFTAGKMTLDEQIKALQEELAKAKAWKEKVEAEVEGIANAMAAAMIAGASASQVALLKRVLTKFCQLYIRQGMKAWKNKVHGQKTAKQRMGMVIKRLCNSKMNYGFRRWLMVAIKDKDSAGQLKIDQFTRETTQLKDRAENVATRIVALMTKVEQMRESVQLQAIAADRVAHGLPDLTDEFAQIAYIDRAAAENPANLMKLIPPEARGGPAMGQTDGGPMTTTINYGPGRSSGRGTFGNGGPDAHSIASSIDSPSLGFAGIGFGTPMSPEDRASLLVFVKGLESNSRDPKIAKVAPQLMKYKKAIKKLALVGDPRLSACVKAYERTHDSADLVESVEMIAAGMDFNVSPMY